MVMNTTQNVTQDSSKFLTTGYALICVIIFGSFGNILVILSIFQYNLLKNNHYYLVFHLAVCDLLSLLGSAEYSYRSVTGQGWISSLVLCKLASFLPQPFFTAGVYFMVLVAVLRYRAVFYPLRCAVARWKLHLASATVYLFALLCQIPCALNLTYLPPNTCFENWQSRLMNIIYTVGLCSVQFFIPVTLLGVIYWKICCELFEQSKKIKSMNEAMAIIQEETKHWLFQRIGNDRNARAFLTSFTVFVFFLVAGFPQHFCFILYTFEWIELSSYYDWFRIAYYFGVSAINPLIYRALDEKLLSSFKRCGRK